MPHHEIISSSANLTQKCYHWLWLPGRQKIASLCLITPCPDTPEKIRESRIWLSQIFHLPCWLGERKMQPWSDFTSSRQQDNWKRDMYIRCDYSVHVSLNICQVNQCEIQMDPCNKSQSACRRASGSLGILLVFDAWIRNTTRDGMRW